MNETLEPNSSATPSPEDGEVYLKPEIERAYERGEINMTQARQFSGQVAVEHESGIAPETKTPERHLELVTEAHEAPQDARREAKLRNRPPARTPREKAARDQGAALEHKTPPEWSPVLKSVPGSTKPAQKDI